MLVRHLTSVNGEIVFDLDPAVVGTTAGGTRVHEDVTVDEVACLARAMTYKFAAFGVRLGGAKAGIRPRLIDTHAETMQRYCDEIRPLVESRQFLTGADLGSVTTDFASLEDGTPSVFESTVDGVGFEEVVTGLGVAVAAESWLGGLTGRSVAIEGFGKVAHGVALAVVERRGRVVAVSTEHGAVADSTGLDIPRLVEARAAHGSSFVRRLGLDVHAASDLFSLPVDVVVPGVRPGVLNAELSATVQAGLIAPAANVPYTAQGLARLRANGTVPLADFVCNAGAVLVYQAPKGLTVQEVLGRVEREISDRVRQAKMARMDPFDHAVTLADTFLQTWIDPAILPDGPALAPEPIR